MSKPKAAHRRHTRQPLPHLGPWQMLPVAEGACQECARDHSPDFPHDQQSLTYQFHFYGVHGRWPTWRDAMAHCRERIREVFSEELLKMGQVLDAPPE